MKATVVYWHKARIHERYVLEMEIHKVARSAKYPDGVKYGLVFADLRTDKRVLMDNHHPKGPHIHLNDQEMPYRYIDEDKLIRTHLINTPKAKFRIFERNEKDE